VRLKAEALKILDDIFKHEHRRSKELNAEVHCAHSGTDAKTVEESFGATYRSWTGRIRE
jgi:hypothetical protein